MENLSDYYLLITAVFLLAGTIKGTIGIGLPTAAIGIMSQVLEPRTAILLTVIPMTASNAWQVYRAGEMLRTVKRYGRFALSLMVVLSITVILSEQASSSFLLMVIGITIITFSVMKLLDIAPPISDRFNNVTQWVLGTLAGIMGGLTAIWAPPLVIYLLSRNLDKDEFIRASGVLIFLGSVPLLIGFINQGWIAGEAALVSTAMIVPTICGFALGEFIRSKLKSERLTGLILSVFLIMGLNLLRRAFF